MVKVRENNNPWILPLLSFVLGFYSGLRFFPLWNQSQYRDVELLLMRFSDDFFSLKPVSLSSSVILSSLYLGLFFLMVYETYALKQHRNMQKDAYGSARWNKKNALKKIREKSLDDNWIFSESEIVSMAMHKTKRNRNAIIIGRPGTGKSRYWMLPNLLHAGDQTLIITDPKEELLKSAGSFLKKQGYDIKVFNLKDKSRSNHYNPFVYIKKQNPSIQIDIENPMNLNEQIVLQQKQGGDIKQDDVMSLINTIMINTDGAGSKSSDPFWDKAEMVFLQAIFYYVLYNEPKEKQNMNSVLKLIRLGMPDENGNIILKSLFDAWEDRDPSNIGVLQWKHFWICAGNENLMSSIVMTASARLAVFNLKEIRELISKDDMELDRIGQPIPEVYRSKNQSLDHGKRASNAKTKAKKQKANGTRKIKKAETKKQSQLNQAELSRNTENQDSKDRNYSNNLKQSVSEKSEALENQTSIQGISSDHNSGEKVPQDRKANEDKKTEADKPRMDGKVAYFVITSPNDSSFQFLATLFYSQIFSKIDELAEKAGGSFPTPVNLWLDEFAQLGKIPGFIQNLAYVRGLNVGVTILLQSLSQIKMLYGDEWPTILDCADYWLFLGSQSKETLEYLSALLGDQTLHVRHPNDHPSRKNGGRTWTVYGRNLATIDELAQIPKGYGILQVSGIKPFFSKLYNLEKDPRYKSLFQPWTETRGFQDSEFLKSKEWKENHKLLYDHREYLCSSEQIQLTHQGVTRILDNKEPSPVAANNHQIETGKSTLAEEKQTNSLEPFLDDDLRDASKQDAKPEKKAESGIENNPQLLAYGSHQPIENTQQADVYLTLKQDSEAITVRKYREKNASPRITDGSGSWFREVSDNSKEGSGTVNLTGKNNSKPKDFKQSSSTELVRAAASIEQNETSFSKRKANSKDSCIEYETSNQKKTDKQILLKEEMSQRIKNALAKIQSDVKNRENKTEVKVSANAAEIQSSNKVQSRLRREEPGEKRPNRIIKEQIKQANQNIQEETVVSEMETLLGTHPDTQNREITKLDSSKGRNPSDTHEREDAGFDIKQSDKECIVLQGLLEENGIHCEIIPYNKEIRSEKGAYRQIIYENTVNSQKGYDNLSALDILDPFDDLDL